MRQPQAQQQQHNPQVADKLSGQGAALEAMAKRAQWNNDMGKF